MIECRQKRRKNESELANLFSEAEPRMPSWRSTEQKLLDENSELFITQRLGALMKGWKSWRDIGISNVTRNYSNNWKHLQRLSHSWILQKLRFNVFTIDQMPAMSEHKIGMLLWWEQSLFEATVLQTISFLFDALPMLHGSCNCRPWKVKDLRNCSKNDSSPLKAALCVGWV